MNNTVTTSSGLGGGIYQGDSSAPLQISGTSFFANGLKQTATGRTVACGAVPLVQSSNIFCQSSNVVSCSSWSAGSNLAVGTCSVCDGVRSNYTDCEGTCWGVKSRDTNGTCCRDCDKDCTGMCYGVKVTDLRGTCCLPSQINSADGQCCFGTVDYCGVCNGTDDCIKCESECQNGGVCVKQAGTAYCNCTNGYSGGNCTTFSCVPNCKNGGVCTAPNSCDCEGTGYFGEDCGASNCGANVCMHNGVCIIATSTCNCTGTGGYFGEQCANFTCANACKNGKCGAPDTCDCTNTGYSGTLCDAPVCFGEVGCANGGKCIKPNQCDCAGTNYEGAGCETPIVEPPVASSSEALTICTIYLAMFALLSA